MPQMSAFTMPAQPAPTMPEPAAMVQMPYPMPRPVVGMQRPMLPPYTTAPAGIGPVSQATYAPAGQQSYPSMPPAGAYANYPQAAMGNFAPVPNTALPSSNSMTVPQLMATLKDALYPSQREWAADQLGRYDRQSHPEIVEMLVQKAQSDPSATVRAGCVHSLNRLNAGGAMVAATLQALRADPDPRVQNEAERGLARLTPGGH
jgi:hypothetical protein